MITIINAGQKWDDSEDDNYLKIFLTGTVGEGIDWQDGFIKLLNEMSETEDYKDYNFLVINPQIEVSNPEISLDNPEFIEKTQWELEMIDKADFIFCNILKKSTSESAIRTLLLELKSQKIIVRCPSENIRYPLIKVLCESYNVPVLGAMATMPEILSTAFSAIPRLVELKNFKL